MFGQLFFAQLVQGEELPGQGDVLQEAAGGQLDPDDDLAVGHHHGDIPELDLEVLWQLLPALVGGVHGEEDAELGVHVHVVAVGEDEVLLLLLLAAQDDGDLRTSSKYKVMYLWR